MTRGIKKKNRIMAIIVVLAAIIALVTIVVFLFVDDDLVKPNNGGEIINEKFLFLVEEESILIKNDDIFGGQVNIKNEYIKELEDGNYTIDNPLVKVNPYYIAPQTALVMFILRMKRVLKLLLRVNITMIELLILKRVKNIFYQYMVYMEIMKILLY